MKVDLSLLHQQHHGLCIAVERDGVLCFNNRRKGSRYCSKHITRRIRYKSVDLPIRPSKGCKFIDCNAPHYAKGFCRPHYSRYVSRPRNVLKKCVVPECGSKRAQLNKYCSKHNTRLHRYGSLEGNGKTRGWSTQFKPGHASTKTKHYKKCIVTECPTDNNEASIVKGLCPKHYQRWKKYKDYNFVLRKRKEK